MEKRQLEDSIYFLEWERDCILEEMEECKNNKELIELEYEINLINESISDFKKVYDERYPKELGYCGFLCDKQCHSCCQYGTYDHSDEI